MKAKQIDKVPPKKWLLLVLIMLFIYGIVWIAQQHHLFL